MTKYKKVPITIEFTGMGEAKPSLNSGGDNVVKSLPPTVTTRKVWHGLLTRPKKGKRKHYPTKKLKLKSTISFELTSNESPVLGFIYDWMTAVSNNSVAEVGLMPGADQ